MDGHYTSQSYPEHLRRIRFRDPETAKTLIFLSNHFGLPALTIAALYKNRWQVDIDQSWRLSRFKNGRERVGTGRRQAAPGKRRRSSGFEVGYDGGVGRNELRVQAAELDRAAA